MHRVSVFFPTDSRESAWSRAKMMALGRSTWPLDLRTILRRSQSWGGISLFLLFALLWKALNRFFASSSHVYRGQIVREPPESCQVAEIGNFSRNWDQIVEINVPVGRDIILENNAYVWPSTFLDPSVWIVMWVPNFMKNKWWLLMRLIIVLTWGSSCTIYISGLRRAWGIQLCASI